MRLVLENDGSYIVQTSHIYISFQIMKQLKYRICKCCIYLAHRVVILILRMYTNYHIHVWQEKRNILWFKKNLIIWVLNTAIIKCFWHHKNSRVHVSFIARNMQFLYQNPVPNSLQVLKYLWNIQVVIKRENNNFFILFLFFVFF